MKQHLNKAIALGVLSSLTLGGTLTATAPAQADSKTAKKVAIGAGIVTAYGLLKGKKKVAIGGGLVTAGALYASSRSKKKEEQRRRAWYIKRYGRNWRSHYKSGT